jgi:chromosome segregation ATPase
MKRAAIVAGLILIFSGGLHAQTLEQQLRQQLADTRSQLQDLQGQQAQWQAEKAKLEQERDAARKDADAAKAELGKSHATPPQDTAALASERAARQQAEADVQRLQKAVADANAKAHAQAQQESDMAAQWHDAQQQVATCTAKNQQLYKVGNEILDAYSHMTLGKVMASREPFAASERVKLDNAAQAYGDRLYEQRYDPRATPTPKP